MLLETLCLVLSPFSPLATSYSSHSPGMCCVQCSFTSLDFTLATPLPVEINVHLSRTSWSTALLCLLYKPPSFPYAYKYFVALSYLIIVILN